LFGFFHDIWKDVLADCACSNQIYATAVEQLFKVVCQIKTGSIGLLCRLNVYDDVTVALGFFLTTNH